MKRLILILLGSPALLFVFVVLLVFGNEPSDTIELNTRTPVSEHAVSKDISGSIWQEWCIYTYNDGSNYSEYLSTMDVSKPNYIDINKQAIEECN